MAEDLGGGGGGTIPTNRTGQSTYNKGTKETTTRTPGQFGQFQTNDLAFLLQTMQNSPDYAAQALRLALGQTGRPLGRFASARDNMYGRALQTALSLGGQGGFGSVEDIANQFLQQGVQGNDLMGLGQKMGQQALGEDFSNVDSLTMEKILKSGLALQGLSMGDLGGAVNSGYLDDVIWGDKARAMRLGYAGDQTNFADLLNGSKYKNAMQNFGR